MNSTYLPFTLDNKDIFLRFWEATPQRSIDYALANIWGWERYFGITCRCDGQLCWLRQTLHCETPLLWAPVGDWNLVDWENHAELAAGATLIRVPDTLAHMLEQVMPHRVTLTEDRGHWEYLYHTAELATLPGNRFHKKKNHVNAFRKAYGVADYRPIDAAIMEDVLALEDEWCQWHECAGSPALQAENEAINRVLSHWESISDLVGGAIYVEKTLVAFSVGEALNNTTLGVHYEKARSGYRGVYQVMNSMFAARAGQNFALLNRAQDLNEEGLRQAKMSYLPTDFLRKYTVHVAPV